MCEGEFESLKAIHAVVPSFVPIVYSWGALKKGPGYFLLVEFREIGQQPPDPLRFTMRLAELHKNSISPEGKVGFHVTTCHGNLPQYISWEENWTVMFSKILSRAMNLDENKYGRWPEFAAVRQLLFSHVIPRLLNPLQSSGRTIKPCLIHGDIWDENCADDMRNGEPFAFDAGSLYAHNEYEIGYWRPQRHRLSDPLYICAYKKHFPVSEPGKLSNLLFNPKTALTTFQSRTGTLEICCIPYVSTFPVPSSFLQVDSAWCRSSFSRIWAAELMKHPQCI